MFKSQSSPQLVVLCFDARIDEASVFFGGGGELVEVYGVSIHCKEWCSIIEGSTAACSHQSTSAR